MSDGKYVRILMKNEDVNEKPVETPVVIPAEIPIEEKVGEVSENLIEEKVELPAEIEIPDAVHVETEVITPGQLLEESSSALYRIPVFLSYATPYNALQTEFLERVIEEIRANLLFPRTLGRSDQNTETPLSAIRRMVISSYGLIAFAFRRTFVEEAISRPDTPREQVFEDFWLTSPYLQIEPSMAYQQGLPVTIFVESGVSMNAVFGGILEIGAAPLNIVTFSLNSEQDIDAFFDSVFWRETFLAWVGEVRACYNIRTQPEFKCSCSC